MREFVKQFYHKAGLDSSIVFTIIAKVIQSTGGLFTLFLVTRFLDKNEQGYYYTFASILSIQTFFELGLTSIITQYIAHEAAHLSLENNHLRGDEYYRSRLSSIVHLSVKWFLAISILMFFTLVVAGRYFFSTYHNELHVQWQSPWLILCISTSFILIIDLFFAIFEGLGKIKQIVRYRFFQQLCNLLFVSTFLLSGMKLLSGGVALLLSSTITGIILYFSSFRKIFRNIWTTRISQSINYRREVLPYQFRIATGYISTYFIYHLINPVLFAYQGPVVAGQMGATQAVLNGIFIVALSWATTKVALYSNLVARRKFSELNQVYGKTVRISAIVCIAGLIVFVLLVILLKQYYPKLGNRFLEIAPVVFLGLTQLANVIGASQGYYLRSFKKEPFFVVSIVIGILSGLCTVLCSKLFGVAEITFGYFVINGLIGFTWGCLIFKRKKYKEEQPVPGYTGSL